MEEMRDNILGIKMSKNDAKADTIKDYFKLLLVTLWKKEESFSGKRPFGNSGWQNELYISLVQNGDIEGKIVDGYLEDFDTEKADRLILEAIDQL